MHPIKRHPGTTPTQDFTPPSTEATQTAHERQDMAARHAARAWNQLLWRRLQSRLGQTSAANWMWPVFGILLLVLGSLTFFHYLGAAEIAGGCCGGGLLVLAGVIMLVIGARDHGEFSR